MNTDLNRSDFPRPDFVREDWMSLDGEWEFAFPEQLERPFPDGYEAKALPQKIRVPFCYQSEASGIGSKTYHEKIFYARTFHLTQKQLSEEVLLKFGAVDYHCHIWLNGTLIGTHTGGHTQFEFPVSSFLHFGENRLFLAVWDDGRCDRPRGKQ